MQTQTSTDVTPPISHASEQRVILAVLRRHANEWFIDDDGAIVLVTQVSTFHKDPEHPLYGTVSWHTELDELTTVRQTLAILGY